MQFFSLSLPRLSNDSRRLYRCRNVFEVINNDNNAKNNNNNHIKSNETLTILMWLLFFHSVQLYSVGFDKQSEEKNNEFLLLHWNFPLCSFWNGLYHSPFQNTVIKYFTQCFLSYFLNFKSVRNIFLSFKIYPFSSLASLSVFFFKK